jgi:hypothetical protein
LRRLFVSCGSFKLLALVVVLIFKMQSCTQSHAPRGAACCGMCAATAAAAAAAAAAGRC